MKFICMLPLLFLFACSSAGPEKFGKWELNHDSSLRLTPFTRDSADCLIIGIRAERIKPKKDEYFPNSQLLKVMIEDSSDRIIWNTEKNANFLQMISDVLPSETGATHDYTFVWKGFTFTGKPVDAGQYTAVMTLMTAPENHTLRHTFDWKGHAPR